MPRRARLRISGYPMHLIQRGNNRVPCFREDADYRLYLGLLGELAPLAGCAIHAYVLMTNHVHLLLTPDREESPSQLMKHLGERYVYHFNQRHARSGTLWEGRFRSSIVDTETYLFRCQRYIELNPLRAGLVADPAHYPWSSYRTNAGLESSLVVVPHLSYFALGSNAQTRASAYVRTFREVLSDRELDAIRSAARGGFALGSESFLRDLEASIGRRPGRAKPGRPRKDPGKRGLSPV